MKQLAIALLMLSGTAFGQTPDYFDNDPTWRCSIWNSNQWTPPFISEWEYFVYYLNGDTTAGAYTYHRVYRSGYRDIDFNTTTHDEFFNEPTGLYIRQDGRAIYYFDTNLSVDSLLVDYNKNVGDAFLTFDNSGCISSSDTIQQIDSVLVNTEYRHVFYLDTANNGAVITEGIGHQSFTNFDQGHSLFPWCNSLGSDYVITCYGESLTTYWESETNGQACVLDVSVDENTLTELLVQSNLVSNQIVINQSLNSDEELILLDLNGRVVKRSSSSIISVSDLPSGTYLLFLQQEGATKAYQKIVIQH